MRKVVKVSFGSTGATYLATSVLAPEVSTSSIVLAWVYPRATSDHTLEEHVAAPFRVVAGPCTAGVGFTLYALSEADLAPGPGPFLTGQWFVAVDY